MFSFLLLLWHPRRQPPNKGQQHSHEQLPRGFFITLKKADLREFHWHPSSWFLTCGTSPNLSTIQWTTVTPSPMRSEPQPRECESSFQFVPFWHSKRKPLVSSSHNMSDATCEGLPHQLMLRLSDINWTFYNSIMTIQSWD